jgi:phage-related protein
MCISSKLSRKSTREREAGLRDTFIKVVLDRVGSRRVSTCRLIAEKIYSGVTWSFVFVSAEAQAELDALPLDVRASFERIVRLVQALGLERVREPYIKHIEGPIWEMRLRGRDGIARALYVTATGRRVVILRVFTKKTQKMPRREIELARLRAKEVT